MECTFLCNHINTKLLPHDEMMHGDRPVKVKYRQIRIGFVNKGFRLKESMEKGCLARCKRDPGEQG